MSIIHGRNPSFRQALPYGWNLSPSGEKYSWQDGKSGEAAVLSAYCQSQLESANRGAIHSLDFAPLPSALGWPPAQEASVILKTIMDFMAVHAFPKQVRILCTSELSAAVYCQTWNLWYAESKADRMSIP